MLVGRGQKGRVEGPRYKVGGLPANLYSRLEENKRKGTDPVLLIVEQVQNQRADTHQGVP